MKTKMELAGTWIKKAEQDLLVVEHELSFSDGVTSSICFHCQQALEKFLKAYLLHLELPFPKTNGIGELITQCAQKDQEISAFKEEADKLADCATAVCSPEEPVGPTLAEAKEVYEIAKKMKKYILRKITWE